MRYAGRRRWPLIVPRTDAGGLLQILAGVGDGTGECATLLCMATLPATAANNPRGRGSVQALIPGRGVRALVTAVPIVVPVGMRALFPVLARRLGTRRGHLTGFAVYWTVCYLLPLGLLGRTRVRALLRHPACPLPSPRWLAAAALLVPPLGAAGSELAPELGNADPAVVATAASVAVVNAAGEELLWRGLFVATFPAAVA